MCTNDQNILSALRGLTCSNTGKILTDHAHAECRGVDCKYSEKYTFSFTRKVHSAFGTTAHENIDEAIPICTSSLHNKCGFLSSCCADRSCIFVWSRCFTAPYNQTAKASAAFLCRTMRSRPQSPDRKRRYAEKRDTRPPIPRANAGSQQEREITFNHLFSPMTGGRKIITLCFTPGDATINGALHRWLCCPDPPLVLEATCPMWNPLHCAGCWDHKVPWSFGRDAEAVSNRYADQNMKCNHYNSCFGFQSIHPNHFVFSRYYDVNNLDHFPRSVETSTKFADIFILLTRILSCFIDLNIFIFVIMQRSAIARRKT